MLRVCILSQLVLAADVPEHRFVGLSLTRGGVMNGGVARTLLRETVIDDDREPWCR